MNFAIDTFPPERLGLITGSRCTPLFPKKSAEKGQRTLAKTLANEVFFKCYDEVNTWQMEHGKMAESFAFIHYQKYIDDSIQVGRFLAKDNCGGSSDAELKIKGVDFKSPTTLKNWTDYLFEPLDEDQINQCQMYMWIFDKDKWEIAAYLTETEKMNDNGLVYPVPDHHRMIRIEVERNSEWEVKLKENAPKVIEMRDDFVKQLKERFV